MKIEAKHMTFLPVLPWFGRSRMSFVGRTNTLQLLETALVIEGQRKMLALYVFDLFFQQALSEWTTVTVPYSRIERCRYSARWLARGIVFATLVAPTVVLLVISVVSVFSAAYDGMTLATPPLLFGLLLLSNYLIARILPPRYVLQFRRPDGRLVRTHFRIKTRVMRRAFEQRLNANRESAGRVRPSDSSRLNLDVPQAEREA